MLTSLLPGLRDLRVPLATGFLWLVVLWLLFYPSIPTQQEAVGFAAEVYRTLGAFGPAALVTVAGFVAYVIGILLVRPWSAALRALLRLLRGWSPEPALSPSSDLAARQLSLRTANELIRAKVYLPYAPEDEYDGSFVGRFPGDEDDPATDGPRQREYISRTLRKRMQRDIPLVATRLLADNRELFDRYDRADAEAAFRYSISLPILVVSVLVPWRLGVEWWGYVICIGLGLIVAIVLIFEGYKKQVESNDAIYQAVFVGKVEFPSIEAGRRAIKEMEELEVAEREASMARLSGPLSKQVRPASSGS
ncbi:hypothetical protein [Agromyces sp. Marseille-Q5079]|uniref:hypothetical protein n=1 Tax=Agromyces sp. Marseille-Q5079 TaxID=3439059 RepID=UPI003D9CB7D3